MKRIKSVLFCCVFLVLGKAQTTEVIKKEGLLQLFHQDSGLVVVNFWASWCKPCLAEMALFVKADSIYLPRGIQFVFVNFDMVEDKQRVDGIIAKRQIPGRHYLLDETDMNALIDSVDTGWSGSLPATWFLSPMYRKAWFMNFEHSRDLFTEIEHLITSSDEKEK